jgi:hypothetical protein
MIDKKTSTQEMYLSKAREELLKYGRLSIPFLIRKLKCTKEVAESLIIALQPK